ncbi:MAG: response regulator [Desulfuromonadales bacterium]|nr:response regulator [Desulfuromonadales bacterium]
MKPRILVADDEESIRFTFKEILGDAGYQVDTAETLSRCVQQMQAHAYDLLLLDIGFGQDNGVAAIQSLKGLQPDCAIIIITGSPGAASLIAAKKYGAVDYLHKPIHPASLLYNARKILKQDLPASDDGRL